MKVIKAFSIIIVVWACVVYILFGPGIVNKMAQIPEIEKIEELTPYHGYKVEKLESDWFGNWVFAKKGREEVVLKCSDSIFAQLSVKKSIGK